MGDTDKAEAAAARLGTGPAPATIAQALPPSVFEQLVDQAASNEAYRLPDPESKDTPASQPQQPAPLYYGEGENDYIAVTFEDGQVMVRDGNDETGRAWKYSNEDWAAFVKAASGEEVTADKNESPDGLTPQERAKSYAERTAKLVERDNKAAREAGADQDARVGGGQPGKSNK